MLPHLTMQDIVDALWLLTTPTLDLLLLMHEMETMFPEPAAHPGVPPLQELLGVAPQAIRRYLDIRAAVPEELIVVLFRECSEPRHKCRTILWEQLPL